MALKQEYEKLYRENYRTVYYTALQLMGNATDAEDITQETFISAFVKYAELNEKSSFPAWVKRIAINKCMDQLRKKNPVPTEDSDLELAVNQETEEEFLQEEYVLNEDKRKTVMKIMKEVLSTKQYETVVLFYYDELTVEEIATLLEVPEGTVLSRLSVSRTKIKKGVLEYEKKNHDKLYGMIMAAFLTRVLRAEAAEVNPPSVIPEAIVKAACPDNTIISNPAKAEGKGHIMKKPAIILGTVATAAVVTIGAITIAGSGNKEQGDKPGHAVSVDQEQNSGENGAGTSQENVGGLQSLDLNENDLTIVDYDNGTTEGDTYKLLRVYTNNTDHDILLNIDYEGQPVVGGTSLYVPAHGSNCQMMTGKRSKGINSVEDLKLEVVATEYDGHFEYDREEDYDVILNKRSNGFDMVIEYVGDDTRKYDLREEGFYFVFYDEDDHVVDICSSYASEMKNVQKGSKTAAGVLALVDYDHYQMVYRSRYKDFDATDYQDVITMEYVPSFVDADNKKLLFAVTNHREEAVDSYLSVIAYDENDNIIATNPSVQTYRIEAGDTVYVDSDMMKWQNCEKVSEADHFDYHIIDVLDITPDSYRDKPDVTGQAKFTAGELTQVPNYDFYRYNLSYSGDGEADIYVYINFCDASGNTVASGYARAFMEAGEEKEYVMTFDPGTLNNVVSQEAFIRGIKQK